MPGKHAKLLVASLLVTLSMLGGANAQSWFERLVMPGELVESHAKLEGECSNCHAPFSKGSQRQFCLNCHEYVAGDVSEKRGFHGRRPEVGAQECNHCHTDHKGRGADIVLLDEETFDHSSTDFALRGAHQGVTCGQCHEANKPFRSAATTCVYCHEKVEPHHGRLGRDCATCHAETAWSNTKAFDHSKTKFPLKGAHEKVTCQACHVGEVYKGLPTVCADCHRIQDVHGGRYGDKCETCHASSKWTEIRFDHDRDTKFALAGKHVKVKCDSCHPGDLYRDKLATACIACHRKNDPHQGQLGKACDNCHSPKGWRGEVVFDHDITRFPLIGLHVLVPCEGCHVSAAYRDASIKCADCHARDDYHEGRLGSACARCHNPNGWQRWVFDHNRQSDYPLDGAHAGLDCHACHTKAKAASLEISQDCVACHAGDDKHKGQFGRQCESCHITDNFKTVWLRRKQ